MMTLQKPSDAARNRLRVVLFAVFAGLSLALTSCGDGRKTCYPVSGKLLVDDKPAADCMIQLHSLDPADSGGPNRPITTTITDENGHFKFSTFGDGDGAPAGDYIITFSWRMRSGLMKNQYDGPDRLDGVYSKKEVNKDKPEFMVKIGRQSTVLPDFKLTQSPAAKKRSDDYEKKQKGGGLLLGDR